MRASHSNDDQEKEEGRKEGREEGRKEGRKGSSTTARLIQRVTPEWEPRVL